MGDGVGDPAEGSPCSALGRYLRRAFRGESPGSLGGEWVCGQARGAPGARSPLPLFSLCLAPALLEPIPSLRRLQAGRLAPRPIAQMPPLRPGEAEALRDALLPVLEPLSMGSPFLDEGAR